MSHKLAPSAYLVGGLIAVAVITALILWVTLLTPDDNPPPDTQVVAEEPVDTAAADPATDEPSSDPDAGSSNEDAEPPAVPEPVGAVALITSVAAFDPEGNFEEKGELADAAIADADPSTSWRTECYSNQFMGAKRGVGLVVSFDRPLEQGITFEVPSAPYQVQFFEWDGDTAPMTIDGWGEPIGRSFGPDPATVSVDSSDFEARHLLLLLNEIGPDDGCSVDNPYRGAIDEITILG